MKKSYTASWQDLLARPATGDHVVQVYQDEAFLAEVVSLFIGVGLRQGEGVVVIARPADWRSFAIELERQGCAPDEALASGQLEVMDAADTLAKFMLSRIRACYAGAGSPAA